MRVRTFIAFELVERIREELSSIQRRLRSAGADVRWVRSEGFHLTLKFLGDVEEEILTSIHAAVGNAAEGHGPLRLKLVGAGAFPNIRRPRVLWAGLGGETERLAELAGKIDNSMSELGFESESRNFKPHLTIGRVKSGRNLRRLAELLEEEGTEVTDFTACNLHVIRSELNPGGARYSSLYSTTLNDQE